MNKPYPSLRNFTRPGLILILLILPLSVFARTDLSPTYSATLVESEFRNLPDVDGEKLTGNWLIQFLPGNGFRMLKDGTIMVDGTWVVKEGRLTLTGMSGPLVCHGETSESAAYTVIIRGFSVAFKKVTDDCPERSAVLTIGAFRTVAN